MILDLFLLSLMVIAAIWAVMARSLLKGAVGLAIVSVIITIFMFKFNSALAGVFELSVCTGLITVIFLSTIGLTKPLTAKQVLELSKERMRRYGWLPISAAAIGALAAFGLPLLSGFKTVVCAGEADVRNVLWNLRHMDLFGQILIIIAGCFGAVILFKEVDTDGW